MQQTEVLKGIKCDGLPKSAKMYLILLNMHLYIPALLAAKLITAITTVYTYINMIRFFCFFFAVSILVEVIAPNFILAVSNVIAPGRSWANVIRTQYLIPNKRDSIYLTSTMVGAILNLIINWMLIPKYQANGAAFGTIVAEFSVSVCKTG